MRCRIRIRIRMYSYTVQPLVPVAMRELLRHHLAVGAVDDTIILYTFA